MIEQCDKQGTRRFYSVQDVELANSRAGQHFFDADTMRFFNSRVLGDLIDGRYFVTSERFDENHPRLYTLREAMPNGHIETVGEFQGYTSARAAYTAARKLAEKQARLEELRIELRAERISWGELAELQDLAPYIDPGDVELLEAAGIPEGS